METIGAIIINTVKAREDALSQLAETLGADPTNLAHALLDPAFDLEGAYRNNTLVANLRDPLTFASCYPTAAALFGLLTGNGNNAGTGANRESYHTEAQIAAEMEALIAELEGLMRHDPPAGAVVRMEVGGHGFILIVRPDEDGNYQGEIIESLAASAAIGTSLQRRAYTPGEMLENLRGLVSGDLDRRVEAAANLGWNAHALYLGREHHTGTVHFPGIRLKWWASNLIDDGISRWIGRAKAQFNYLASEMGLDIRW